MNTSATSAAFFIGWDVGGWNCDRNTKSRDAVVILDSTLAIVGNPWRGNLRKSIAAATTTREWLMDLFTKCGANCPDAPLTTTMAIDTPLGFSDEFIALITRRSSLEPSEMSGQNRYLFRHTERHLFELDLTPLSSVKDMIGSQATKGMHVLAKFAPIVESCGVWTDGAGFHAIETYPTACRKSPLLADCITPERLDNEDLRDAYLCAVTAHIFATDRSSLEAPPAYVPISEGWIWAPPQPIRPRTGAPS